MAMNPVQRASKTVGSCPACSCMLVHCAPALGDIVCDWSKYYLCKQADDYIRAAVSLSTVLVYTASLRLSQQEEPTFPNHPSCH